MYIHLTAFFEHSQLCFHVVYPFGFFVMISQFPYFAPKFFCISRIQLLLLHPFSPYLLVEFFSLFWNILFCLYCLVLSWYLFTLPSFASINLIFRSSRRGFFSVSSESILMFRFSILTCCRNFICDFSQSSHPSFNFLSVVLSRTPIFSQTNFALAYIKSFNSVMSFVGIFVNTSFHLSVSDLTVL